VSAASYDVQYVLLRALDERRPGDVRVVAAAGSDLELSLHQGRFRLGLYYQLADVLVHVPPLRDRLEDLPELTEDLIRSLQRDVALSADALQFLWNQPWPGNVTELKALLRRALRWVEDGAVMGREELERAMASSSDEQPCLHSASGHTASLLDSTVPPSALPVGVPTTPGSIAGGCPVSPEAPRSALLLRRVPESVAELSRRLLSADGAVSLPGLTPPEARALTRGALLLLAREGDTRRWSENLQALWRRHFGRGWDHSARGRGLRELASALGLDPHSELDCGGLVEEVRWAARR